MSEMVDSTSDKRTVNNVMRREYKVLSDNDKIDMKHIKDLGLEMHDYLEGLQQETEQSKELEIAKQKIEEAVMWAVKQGNNGR